MIKSIVTLRAFSLLLVLFFHFFPSVLPNGFVGVDLFLLISGFLMAKSLKRFTGLNGFLSFLKHRMNRLLPAYFAFVFFALLLGLSFGGWHYCSQWLDSCFASILAYSNLLFGSRAGYFDTLNELDPFLHTWSLSLEWQFYLSLALLSFVKRRFRFYIVFSGVIFSLLFTLIYVNRPTLIWFSPLSRFFEFGIGFLLFYIPFRLKLSRFIINMLLICQFAFILHGDFSIWPGIKTLVLIVLAIPVLIAETQFDNIGIVSWLGRISYEVYLLHYPIVALLKYYDLLHLGSALLFLLFSLLLGNLLHKYVKGRVLSKPYILAPILSIIGVLTLKGSIASAGNSDYVKSGWDACVQNSLDSAEVLLIGDSYAQDYLNILLELEPDICSRLSLKFIDMDCGNVFMPEEHRKSFLEEDEALKCNGAEINSIFTDGGLLNRKVILASNWKEWQLDFLGYTIDTLKEKGAASVTIILPKHWGKVNEIRSMKLLESDSSLVLRSHIPVSIQRIRQKIESICAEKGSYVYDVMAPFEDEQGYIYGENGSLYTYDGGHLTKSGVKEYVKRNSIPK